MQQYRFVLTGLAIATALAVGCSRHSASPTSPSGTSPTTSATDAGVTLKATAPTLISPINDDKLEDRPILRANPATLKFADGTLQYQFQVMNEAGVVVADSNVVASTTYTVPSDLDFEKRHTWRVRAAFQGGLGPWSNLGSFITAAGAYLRGNELRDPLMNGKTVATAMNDVTFMPGVGVMLNSRNSYLEWPLATPLESGEFSAVMTNIGEGAETWKTKVMSMLQGDGVNITDNIYRVTIDKRTAWANQNSVVRFTIRVLDDSDEVKGGPQGWDSHALYFWKFEWGNNVARIRVWEGGVHGALKEDLSTTYKGVFRPNPHLIRLGSVGGRGGDDTNPFTIVRNVWVSSRPRPNFSGDN